MAKAQEAMWTGGLEAVALLERLAAAAPDDLALGTLGAGAFEDLVDVHGLKLGDDLDAALQREPRLREAVRHVRSGSSSLSPTSTSASSMRVSDI